MSYIVYEYQYDEDNNQLGKTTSELDIDFCDDEDVLVYIDNHYSIDDTNKITIQQSASDYFVKYDDDMFIAFITDESDD
jgi:hypothetical protein